MDHKIWQHSCEFENNKVAFLEQLHDKSAVTFFRFSVKSKKKNWKRKLDSILYFILYFISRIYICTCILKENYNLKNKTICFAASF